LEDVGVSPENIGFANVTMSSEKFICIRENKQSSKAFLRIIDFRNGIEITEKPMTADSAIMNPNLAHLALRGMFTPIYCKLNKFCIAQNTIQVFDIDSKDKISSIQINFEVIFWNWADENHILLVSDAYIFLWEYKVQDSVPIKWFDKTSTLDDCQIINSGCDKSGKWCYVSGISLKVNYLFTLLFHGFAAEWKNFRFHSII
jgi:clathrin heavy chain